MEGADPLQQTISNACETIGKELEALTASGSIHSHQLAEFTLENVLLHQAAAQQLQGASASLVHTGQQLLATSRQMAPRFEQLAAMAQAAKQLRADAEQLQQLGLALQRAQQPPAEAPPEA